MLNNELKKIKKKFGEEMMHLCRDNFSTLLDMFPNSLLTILTTKFDNQKSLAKDIIANDLIESFKNYIYSFVDVEQPTSLNIYEDLTPYELMNQAGYTLYKCESEEEIQNFKKYYLPGEELCTFKGNRLFSNYVYFAIKHNAEELKRKDFKRPNREDEYGRSVISIQFSKNNYHTLSIKNRYNHSVNNPDSTFSNNLDNIIPGLTESFSKYEGMKQLFEQGKFNLTGYVLANDGKYYKSYCEKNNISYCTNNVIIDNSSPKKYPKEQVIVADIYIIDFAHNKIELYDKTIKDNFITTLGENITINKEKRNNNTVLHITDNDNPSIDEIIIELNENNNIIGYINNNITEIQDFFMISSKWLKYISLNNVKSIGKSFLLNNTELKSIELPYVENIGSFFLSNNSELYSIELPKVKTIGDDFLQNNYFLRKLDLPEVISIGNVFLFENRYLEEITLPKLKVVGTSFLFGNKQLTSIYLPNIEEVGMNFINNNFIIKKVYMPKLKYIKGSFLNNNRELKKIAFQNLITIGDDFISNNKIMEEVYLPRLQTVGYEFLSCNLELTDLVLPNLLKTGNKFMNFNNKLVSFIAPNLKHIGSCFLANNVTLKKVEVSPIIESEDEFHTPLINANISYDDCPKNKVLKRHLIY